MNLSTALASSQSSSSLSTLSRSRKVYTVNDHATSSNTSGQTWAWVYMNFKSSLNSKVEKLFERMSPHDLNKPTICLYNLYEEILILFKRMWCFEKVLPHLLILYSSWLHSRVFKWGTLWSFISKGINLIRGHFFNFKIFLMKMYFFGKFNFGFW